MIENIYMYTHIIVSDGDTIHHDIIYSAITPENNKIEIIKKHKSHTVNSGS